MAVIVKEIIVIIVLTRFEDVATIKIPHTCPAQVKEKGENKFRVRAFFENYYGQDGIWKFRGTG